MYVNGKSLLDLPIKERRPLLEKYVNVIPNRVELSELTIADTKSGESTGDDPLKLLMAKVLLYEWLVCNTNIYATIRY